jgi:hypothetical protein
MGVGLLAPVPAVILKSALLPDSDRVDVRCRSRPKHWPQRSPSGYGKNRAFPNFS